MEMKHATFSFECKKVTDEGEFEGLASTFDNIDQGNDRVVRGAFRKTLKEWKAKGQLPLMTWQHDIFTPVGSFQLMKETAEGLVVEGKLWLGAKITDFSRMAHNLLTDPMSPKGLSIGFRTLQSSEDVEKGERIRNLEEIKLFEIGIVPFGMNELAVISDAKSLVVDGKIKEKRDFEKALRDMGLSQKQAKTFISQGYNGLQRDVENEGQDGFKQLLDSINNHSQLMKG